MSSILKVDQLQDSGGNALITSNGSGTITAGAVTNTPSFFVKADGTQNITYATATKLEFTNVLYNTNTCFDTSNNRFTPGVAGKYVISGAVGISAMDDGEFVIAYMLSHAKHLPELYALQAQRQWKRGFNIKELTDTTLLIIGAGSIGQEIAARAKPFGIKVLGSRRHPQPLPNFDLVVGALEWRHLLPKADYVVIATPLTPETKGLIDEAALRLLSPHAYLINIARGAIIDENALVKALKEKWFAGAALDTTTIEPLPADSPLWSLDNVFLTPHCTAHSPKLNQRSVKLFIDNLTRFQVRLPLQNVVDKQAGY